MFFFSFCIPSDRESYQCVFWVDDVSACLCVYDRLCSMTAKKTVHLISRTWDKTLWERWKNGSLNRYYLVDTFGWPASSHRMSFPTMWLWRPSNIRKYINLWWSKPTPATCTHTFYDAWRLFNCHWDSSRCADLHNTKHTEIQKNKIISNLFQKIWI